MIVIDGQKTELSLNNFENLEQVFLQMKDDGKLNDRIVTDVYVNSEPFSEIYPHQSEDVDTSGIQSLEIRTMDTDRMAAEITRELYKVVTLMGKGGDRVADLFRQADDAEALETYQDLMDVLRDFVAMVGVLRDEYSLKEHESFNVAAEEFDALFGEMAEVLENEDWILLADLLEYEFKPAVERWKKVIAQLREDIRVADKG